MTEEWRPVVGYEGLYEVSSVGRVRSLHRVIQRRNHSPQTIAARILKCRLSRGYPMVSLWRHNHGRSPKVHVLMAAAFIGPRPDRMFVLHNDDVRTNNVLSNLRYGTRVDNAADAMRHGSFHFGEAHHQSKLTREQVVEMRRLHRQGIGYRRLGKRFGVSRMTARSVVLRLTWQTAG